MPQYDWSKFSQKIYINARMQEVYDAWTTRINLENWFLRKAEFTKADGTIRDKVSNVQKGDTYEWMWHGHPDSTAENGIVTEANGKDKFQFTFGEAGVVSIHLKRVDDNTEIMLTQDQIPTDEHGKASYHLGCSTGWTFYLANLKSRLEGGLDLRNKNLAHKGVINS